jgi:hypothetical protein
MSDTPNCLNCCVIFITYTCIFLRVIKTRKANWIGHNLGRSCFLKHVIEGNIEGRIKVTGRQGRRHKQLLDDRKEKRE